MRLLTIFALVLAGCATAAAESTAEARVRRPRPRGVAWDARPLDALLAEAGRAGKRVVVDFAAEW